jgi:hypothetical protein
MPVSPALWYVERRGVLSGPIPTSEIQRLVGSGSLPPDIQITPRQDIPPRSLSELGPTTDGIVWPGDGPLLDDPKPPEKPAVPPGQPPPPALKKPTDPPVLPPKPLSKAPPLAWAPGCPPARVAAEKAQCVTLTAEQSAYLASLQTASQSLQASCSTHNTEVNALNTAAQALQIQIDQFNADVADYNAKWDQYQHSIQLITIISPAIQNAYDNLVGLKATLDAQQVPLQVSIIQMQDWQTALDQETSALFDAMHSLADLKHQFIDLLRALLRQFTCTTCQGLLNLIVSAGNVKWYFQVNSTLPLPPLTLDDYQAPTPPTVSPNPGVGGPTTTSKPCPCTYSMGSLPIPPPVVWISLDSFPLANHFGNIGIDAMQPSILVSAGGIDETWVSCTASDGSGTPSLPQWAGFPLDRWDYTWTVESIDVPAFAGTKRSVVGTIATARTNPPVALAPGAQAAGKGLQIVIDPLQMMVDSVTGTAPAQTITGALANVTLKMKCDAKSEGGLTGTVEFSVALAGTVNNSAIPAIAADYSYLATLTGGDFPTFTMGGGPVAFIPNYVPGKPPTGCSPVLQYTIGQFVAAARSDVPLAQTGTAGDVLALEIDASQMASVHIVAMGPGCPVQTLQVCAAKSRPQVKWKWQWSSGPGSVSPDVPLLAPSADPGGIFVMLPYVRDESVLQLTANVNALSADGSGATVQRATVVFQITVKPRMLQLTLLDESGNPASHQRYQFQQDSFQGDITPIPADGNISEVIDPLGVTATLQILGTDQELVKGPPCSFDLAFGGLYSTDSVTGMRSRINNLGLAVLGELAPVDANAMQRAIQRFQTVQHVWTAPPASAPINTPNVSGVLDDATRAAMEKFYDE